MNEFFKRDNCRICGSGNLELVMEVASTPIGDDFIAKDRLDKEQNVYPLELNVCDECRLVQVSGVVDPNKVYGEYLYESSISLGLSEHFQDYADCVVRRIDAEKDNLVIDIGSNDGVLLRFFQQKGLRVVGIVPAVEIAKKVNDSGIRTMPKFFTNELAIRIRNEHGPAAIVTANNVLANVDDLIDMIKGIRELLRSDGIFVFETGYMIDLIQNCVLENIYHEHLCYFSVKPLVRLFNDNGMEIFDIDRVPTKGGSIRGFVQLAGGPRRVSPSVNGLMSLETELGFDRLSPFKAFTDRSQKIKRELLSVLHDLRADGKRIAAYGASVGLTTLLYYFDIGNMVDVLYDDNPIKHNLFSPGYHIPVCPSDRIYKQSPDFITILAWRYSNPIVKKHKTYLENGGHFILPLPSVEVI